MYKKSSPANRGRFVLVLSTNIQKENAYTRLLKVMISMARDIIDWSIDLSDEDNVLRLVCDKDISSNVVHELERASIRASLLRAFDKADPELAI
jgi:hypothetical protein